MADGVKSQSAYSLRVASSRDLLTEKADLWQSGMLPSNRSIYVPYEGKPLASRQQVFWQVKFRDQDGNESGWSEAASFELGLLTANEWQAKWMQLSRPAENKAAEQPTPKIAITKATYGVPGDPAKQIDVTKAIQRKVRAGRYLITPNNKLAGKDPAFGVVKSLVIDFTLNGRPIKKTVPENKRLNLAPGYRSKTAGDNPFVPEYFRRELQLDSKPAKARLYVTARGLFEMHINGKKVGDAFMAPGWTPYHKWIETITHDVTDLLQPGNNAIGAILGEGWYGGRIGWLKPKDGFPKPWLLAQLEITYADGRVETITTDDTWKGTRKGPIRFSGIYDGETYDARMELGAISQSGFDDSEWLPVVTEDIDPKIRLTPKRHHPTRAVRQLPAVTVTEPAPGKFVFDLGQNMVGWPELKIPVQMGQMVTVRYAEMLNKDGTLYTANYRSAKSINHYTAGKDGTATWHPTFTFHGFRYVELSGFPEGVKSEKSWVTGHVLHSDFGWGGTFASSHQKLNTLQRNIRWGLRGNFLDIPTDCPQRDERLGWTGDAQVFAPTSLFNAKVHSFWASWLESMRDDQLEAGFIPSVIPNCMGPKNVGGSGWSDAATVVPWEVYTRTGDLRILEDNFEMMKKWTGYHASTSTDFIATMRSYGDWLQPHTSSGKNVGDTPKELIGTAYFARSADLT
ncbi:MAG: family 78 glycoside hydrolase catalytic domain, partial [Verrucomicrobiae bacterium]|nr:family 78 glycoside hydrolase catalytic domain [Verrucomicrobiae bacterium]